MRRVTHHDFAAGAAERLIRDLGISSLPVDPIEIARRHDIDVEAKPAANRGVSGMLIWLGDQFCIAYATHIKSEGFRRFSVAHELGHYFLEGHVDALFEHDTVHESRAGFQSDSKYELEADRFAARLLMPNALFYTALRDFPDGLEAVEGLAKLCCTSLPATAIRYAECVAEPVAIVLSSDASVEFAEMSRPLKDFEGIDWIRKGQPLPRDSATWRLNSDPRRVASGSRESAQAPFDLWFGGTHRIGVKEEALGLGDYGKTLTVLYGIELPEDSRDHKDDDDLIESWTPRHRR